MSNFCIDCTVNRVNAIGGNSNFSYQLRTEFHCASPIPFYVFLSCDIGILNSIGRFLVFIRKLARIQRSFSSVKIENFIGKMLLFLIFLLKILIVGSNEYPQSMFLIKKMRKIGIPL